MIKLVIFDFDGTLVDTITDVVVCFNDTLAEFGYKGYTVEEFHRFVGGNLETIVSSMLPEESRTPDEINKVKEKYRFIYQNSDKPYSLPYNGIIDVLDTLVQNNIKIAINSNKGQALLDDMVKKCFPVYEFTAIMGYQEHLPSKPDPYAVNKIIEDNSLNRDEVVYIGDGHSDISTAHNAKIKCILASWGQTQQSDLSDERVWKIANEPIDIIKLLDLKGN